MSQPQRGLSQGKEAQLRTYQKRLKEDIRAMSDNFEEIIKLSKIEDESQINRATQVEGESYEIQVRATNMVRAGESLLKLITDLKQFFILNDFRTINEAMVKGQHANAMSQAQSDKKLTQLRDEMTAELFELEEEYYSSQYK